MRWPLGTASAEEEFLAAYEDFFVLKGEAYDLARDIRAADPGYGSDVVGGHYDHFAPRVCSALQELDSSVDGGGELGGGGGAPGPAPGPSPEPDDGEGDGESDDSDADADSDPPTPPVPPRASFSLEAPCDGEPCRARTGLPVSFVDTSSGTVSRRDWEFGDGLWSRSRTPEHAWSSPGFYTVSLTVSDGATDSTATRVFLVEASDPAGDCEPDPHTLCLQDSRYELRVDWWDGEGQGGEGQVVHSGTNEAGLFRFFDRENWDVLVKVLDGCGLNGNVWFYAAATTNLGYTITVRDSVTGRTNTYGNEPDVPAPAVTDVFAFPLSCRR